MRTTSAQRWPGMATRSTLRAPVGGRGEDPYCRAHGSSEGHGILKRNDKYHSIADDVPIPKM